MTTIRPVRQVFGILFGAALILTPFPAMTETAQAPKASSTIWDGVYSEAQARRGEQVFRTACSYCHKDDLSGGFFDDGQGRAPALAGKRAFDSSFLERWGDSTLAEFVATVAATMPQSRPSSLSLENYIDVVSYVLSKNDVPAGPSDLPGNVDALGAIAIGPKK